MPSIKVGTLKFDTHEELKRVSAYEDKCITKPECTVTVKVTHSGNVGKNYYYYGQDLEIKPPDEMVNKLFEVYQEIEKWVKEELK